MVGIALPVWIDSARNSYHHYQDHGHDIISKILPHLGWISIGIGDSIGAIIGTYYGKHKVILILTLILIYTNTNIIIVERII